MLKIKSWNIVIKENNTQLNFYQIKTIQFVKKSIIFLIIEQL